MTDPNDWAAPGAQDAPRWGERVPSAPPAPPSAPAADAGQQPPAYGQQPPAYGQQPPASGQQAAPQPQGGPGAWTPPPRPGLLPLRPFTFGEILSASFQVFRRNPRTTFGTALLAQVVLLVVTVGAAGGSAFFAFSRVESALPEDRDAVAAGAVATVVLATLVPVLLTVVVSALLQGLFVLETSRQLLGERLRLGGLWTLARGRIGALTGWSALLTLAYLVAAGLVVGVVAIGVVVGTGPSIGVGIGVGVLLGLGLLVLGVWLTIKLSLVPSALMLERMPLRAAVARSWSLVRSSFWRTFGVVALVFVMIQIATQVVTAPFSLLFGVFGSLISPTGDVDGSAIAVAAVAYVLTIAVSAVVTAIGSVVQAASVGLVYVDRRMRTEGLDLELVRHVEARGRGQVDLPDPWRSPAQQQPGQQFPAHHPQQQGRQHGPDGQGGAPLQ